MIDNERQAVYKNDLTQSQLTQIANLLGREPRGLVSVEAFGVDGDPAVLRVEPLVGDKPFPTLFWLIHPVICYWLDRLEANGVIGELQAEVDRNLPMQEKMGDYHRWYISERWRSASSTLQEKISQLGYREALEQKGVGGLGNYGRIRCLHTWYGAHIVKPNPVGEWLDTHPYYQFSARSGVK